MEEQPNSDSKKPEQPNSDSKKPEQPNSDSKKPEQPNSNSKKPEQPNSNSKKPEQPNPVDPIITSHCLSSRQLNLLSVLNKEWHTKESESRREVLVSNVWAIAPHRVIERFPNLHSIVLVNPIPRNLAQQNRGLDPTADSFRFWHTAALKNHKVLERLTLRHISITDEDLNSISAEYPELKALTLISCTGFSIIGIEAVAANCSNLMHLIVRSCTLIDSDSKGELLTSLHAESMVSLEMPGIKGAKACIGDPRILLKFMKSAARLEHLGVVVNMMDQKAATTETCKSLSTQLKVSRKLESLSLGSNSLLSVPGCYIRAFQPVASQIISLNIRDFKSGDKKDQTGLIKNCINLRTLQACSFGMNDDALHMIGKHCTKLEKVKLLDSLDRSGITENGLKHIANGYPQLKSLSVCVTGMTCESLVFFAQSKRDIECFKLYVEDLSFIIPGREDNAGILDQGFVRLVQLCQKLQRLRASNVSTELFSSIAGNNLEVLIVKVAAAAVGKTPYLRGLARSCPRLEKLGIQDCSFPSLPKDVFLTKAFKCLWMKSCEGCIDLGECRKASTVWRDVNLHVVGSTGQHDLAKVYSVYIYKTCVPGQAFFQ